MKKNLITLGIFLFLLLGSVFIFPSHISAQITNPVIGSLGNDAAAAQSGSTFTQYFITIWRAVIFLGVLMLLINLVSGAFEWILAGGEHAKVQKGRDKMTQSVIGMIVLAMSFTLVSFLSQTLFSFDLLNLTIPKVTPDQSCNPTDLNALNAVCPPGQSAFCQNGQPKCQ